MEHSGIQKSLSFDDVLIKPARSEVLPNHVLTKISLTKKINLERSNQRKIDTEERKSKAIKNYPTLLSNCEEIISSYQESDIPINISFYNDCITLISYANQKLSEDILSRKALLDILKFARINVFTFLENEDEEKVQKISNSLAKSIKKFSKK